MSSFVNFAERWLIVQKRIIRNRFRTYQTEFLRDLAVNGFATMDGVFPKDTIKSMLHAFPKEAEFFVSPEGTETKTYLFQSPSQPFSEFFDYQLLETTCKIIIGDEARPLRQYAHIRDKTGWIGSFEQFYHFDTWQHRIKFFLYLTDVGPSNAPLVYIPKTQGSLFRLKKDYDVYKYSQATDNNYMADDLSQFVGSFFPHQVAEICRRKRTIPIEITGPAGTLVAFDGRGIHRSKPLESGERRVLASYWIDGDHHI